MEGGGTMIGEDSRRTPEGDEHGYVGQLIDPDWGQDAPPADPVEPPRLEG